MAIRHALRRRLSRNVSDWDVMRLAERSDVHATTPRRRFAGGLAAHVLVASLAAVLVASMAVPASARPPVALGLSNAASTDMATVDAVSASIGVRPATWTLWSTWGDRGGQAACSEGVGTCAFPRVAADGLRERGITPLIYWQPTNPANPGAGWYERFRLTSAGKHDRYIRAWAKAAKDFGRPVIVRFAHEMNGTWFPWSLTNFDNSPAAFKGAWRHIVRQFRRVGADNVRFLWSPFQRCPTCSSAYYEDFYPGNGWVDYVGVTALNWGDVAWTSLDGLLAEPLTMLRRLTRTPDHRLGKPVILPETGSNHIGGDKAAWIRDGYAAAHATWPAIRLITYFDYDTTFAGQPDWRLVQPPDGSALAAFQSLAVQPDFRAAFPLRPDPSTGHWRLMPLEPPEPTPSPVPSTAPCPCSPQRRRPTRCRRPPPRPQHRSRRAEPAAAFADGCRASPRAHRSPLGGRTRRGPLADAARRTPGTTPGRLGPSTANRYAWPMTDEHDPDLDALKAQFLAAGLLEAYVRDDGKHAYRLTEAGAGVAKALQARGDGSAQLLDRLLRPED